MTAIVTPGAKLLDQSHTKHSKDISVAVEATGARKPTADQPAREWRQSLCALDRAGKGLLAAEKAAAARPLLLLPPPMGVHAVPAPGLLTR